MKLSVIIPVYNEETSIECCLLSLSKQKNVDFEIIIIDDGSKDRTIEQIEECRSKNTNIILLKQTHKGPGAARNLGASKAKGEILVFVDADMEFETDFLEKLVEPIVNKKVIGTFSKDEYLLNTNKSLARCWNLNLGRKWNRMVPENFPNESPVFRAILKESFDIAGGFDTNVGYTDDWSLSRKLNTKAVSATGAKFYHRNPETLVEVWKQARWFGKNEFLTGNLFRKLYNLIRYFPLFAPIKGFVGSIMFKEIDFVVFKTVYDSAVFTSVLFSFLGEEKSK